MGSPSPVLLTGASGKTGRAVARHLVARGQRVRALARGWPAESRSPGGVERIIGDLRDPTSLAEAVRGVATIYHICPNVHPDEVAIGERVVAAARKAGVRRFVFHSVLHPQIEAMPHHWAKMRVEELLYECGLEVTVLQPAPYMQNVLAQAASIREHGLYRVPYALATRVSMVDLEEVAEAAARVLTEAAHEGATYELCAPGLLDQVEIAAALGDALGRKVEARRVPRAAWRRDAAKAGVGRYAIETLTQMFRYYERFGMRGGSRVLEGVLGRPPRAFGQFARRHFPATGESSGGEPGTS